MPRPLPFLSTTTNLSALIQRLKTKRGRVAALLVLMGVLSTVAFSSSFVSRSFAHFLFGGSSRGQAAKVKKASRAFPNENQLAPAVDSSASLTTPRKGHSATLLADGRVLVVGGENQNGFVAQAEILDPSSGSFSASGNLNTARADHTAARLADGRVLIAGGRGDLGSLSSTEIFDPVSGAFTSGPDLHSARAGQSATALGDGRIVFVGGDAAGSVEVYDPQANTFTSVSANLSAPRAFHGAALLNDGRILIAGGAAPDGSPVQSGEILDLANASFTAVANDTEDPHVRALLRLLPDGKVQIIGGTDHEDMEIYDPAANSFGAHAHVYPTGDEHPELVTQILSSPTRAAMFRNGVTDPLLDRTRESITELPGSNQALVAGGVDSNGNTLSSASVLNSSPATVTTDKLDYPPGTPVIVTGTGWQPNESVTVTLHEDPHITTENPHTFTAQADGNGNFTFQQYAPEDADVGVSYIVAAVGGTSNLTAQTSFHDSVTVTAATSGTNISADKAANATSPAFTTLGDIVITEGATTDFADTAATIKTLILTAPSGWAFNAGQGTVSAANGKNISNENIVVTNSTITVSFQVSGTNRPDTLTISGIQVQATNGASLPSSGSILRTSGNPGTATIAGITNDVTNFGSLSQQAGAVSKLVVTLPGQTFTDGSTVATSGNSGSPTAQNAGVSFNISNITATDQFFNVVTSYTGAKTISYSGPGSNPGFSPTYTTAVSFTNGVSTTTLATTLMKAETTTITASDGTTSGPASSSLTVIAGSLSSFAVTNTSDGPIGTQTAGTAFNIKIRAIDAGGNTVTSYSGGQNKIALDSVPSGNLSSPTGASPSFAFGVLGSLSVTFSTSGSYPGTFSLIAAGDTGGSGNGVSGTSNSFTVNAAPCSAPTSASLSPNSQTLKVGDTLTLNATATGGTSPYDYVYKQGVTTVVTHSSVSSSTDSYTKTNIGATDAGSYTVVVNSHNCAGSGNATSGAASVTVNKRTASIAVSFGSNSITYGGNTTATATVTDTDTGTAITPTGTVTFSSDSSDNFSSTTCALVAGALGTATCSVTVTPAHASTHNISAAWPGDSSHTAPANASSGLTVNPKTLTASVTASNKNYDGNTNATINGCTLSGVINSDVVICAAAGPNTFADANVGNGKTVTATNISLSGANAGNYTLNGVTSETSTANITTKAITATLNASDKTYDGTNTEPKASMSCSLTGVLAGDSANVTCTATGGTFNTSNVATANQVTATVTISGTASGNYTLGAAGTTTISTSATATAHITAKSLTASVTASNKTYDGNTPATITTCSLSGVLAGDTANITCSAAGPNTFADANVGTAKTVTATNISLSGTASGNYSLSSTSATTTADITTKAITATLSASDKTYDGTNTEPKASMSCSLTGVLAGDSANVTCTATSGTFNTSNVATANQVTATVTISGTASGNYTLGAAGTTTSSTSATATAHITAKSVMASVTASNKTYDSNANATITNCSLSGVINPETTGCVASPTAADNQFSDKNFGIGKTVTANNITLTNNAAGNYVLSSTTAATTANINAATLTYTANTASRAYGAANPAFSGSVNGFAGTDNQANATTGTVSFSSPATTTSNVGSYAINGSGLTANNGNYTFVQASGNATALTITAATVTASIVGDPTKVFDGNTNATLTTTNFSLSGLASGESFAVTKTSGTYNNANVATANTVTTSLAPSDFSPGAGTSASNYSLPTSASGPGHITAAHPVLTTTGGTFPYDGNLHASVGTAKGVDGTTNVPGSFTYTYTPPGNSTAPMNASATPYSVSAAFTSSDTNYDNGTPATNSITINKANATVTATGNTCTYSGSACVGSGTATGVGGAGDVLSPAVTLTYDTGDGNAPVNAGTFHVTAHFAGNTNYNSGDSAPAAITINRAPVTATAGSGSTTYDGLTHAPSACAVTGAYTGTLSCTNSPASAGPGAGSTPIGAVVGGDILSNFDITPVSGSYTIGQASSTVTVTCTAGAPHTYTGAAQTPCTAEATGAGMSALDVTASISYGSNTNVGAATAAASWGGDTNHTGNTGNGGFTIGKYTFNVCDGSNCTGGTTPNTVGIGGRLTIDASVAYKGSATATVNLSPASLGGVDVLTSPGVDPNPPGNPLPPSFKVWIAPASGATHLVLFGSGTATKTTINGNSTWHAEIAQTLDSSLVPGSYTAYVYGDDGAALTTSVDNPVLNDAGYVNGDTNNLAFPTLTAPLTVTQATPTITWSNPSDITYGTALSGTQLNATADVGGNFVYTPAAGTVLNAGNGQTLHVAFTPTDAIGYNSTSKDVLINVNKRDATWTTNPNSKTYGDTDPSPLTTGSGSNFVTGDGVTASYSRALGETVAGGPYHITATLSASVAGALDNYNLTNAGANFTINKAGSTTTVTVAGGTSFTYDGNAHPATVSVTGAGNLSLTPDPVYSCGHAPINVADSGCTASYNYSGDDNHTSSTDSKTYTIGKADPVVTATGGTFTYDGSPHAGSGTAKGVKNEDLTPVNVAYKDALNNLLSTAPINAGTYSVSARFAGNDNYNSKQSAADTLIINKKQATASKTDGGGVYKGSAYIGSGTCSDGLTPVITYTPGPGAPVNFGTTSFTVTCGDGNHNYLDGTADGSIVITKAPVTATAGSGSTTYDGLTHAPSACAVTGAYTGTLSCTNSPASAGPGAGSTPIGAVVGGDILSNFDITPVSGSYTIGQASSTVTVTCTAGAPHTYTGAAQTPCTAEATGAGMSALDVTASISYSNNTNVGAATAAASWGGDTNHTGNTGNGGFTIGKYTFNVCDGNNNCTGGTTPNSSGIGGSLMIDASVAYKGSATATVNLSPASLGGVDVLTSPGVDPNPPGNPLPPSFKVWIAPASGATHLVLFGSGTATKTTINGNSTWHTEIAQTLDSSLAPGSYTAYVYGDDGAALTTSADNPVLNDAGYVNGDTNNLAFPTLTAPLTITKATPTVTATGGTFTYDGNAHAGSGSVTGVGGDGLTPAVTLTYVPGGDNAPIDAGTYQVTAHFAGNGNYESKDSDPATITINKKDTSASVTASDKPYDGNTTAAIATCTVNGKVGSDDVTCAAGGPNTFDTADAGNGKTVTANGITLGGTKAVNYNLTSTTATTTANINKANSTTTVDALTVTYDGNPHSTTATVAGVGTGFTQSVTWSYSGNCSAAPVNVTDTPCTAKATYAGDSNHNGSDGSNTITINKASSTTTVDALTVTYDGNAHTTTATVAGVGAGFTQTVTWSYSGNCLAAPVNVTDTPCTAKATYAGDANHNGSDGSNTITINRAHPTLTTSGGIFTYDGGSHASTGTAKGVGGVTVSGSFTYTYTPGGSSAPLNASATPYAVSAAFTSSDSNYDNGTPATNSITINKASSTTTVTFESGPYTYRASAFTATAAVTGVNLSQAVTPVTYSGDCTNVTSTNGCTASATFAGDGNHDGSNNNASITITRASSTTTVTFESGPYTYRASAFTATAAVTGVNLSQAVTPVTYSGDCTNVTSTNGCTASATFAGDGNHDGSNNNASITITKANQTISWSNPAAIVYGTALDGTQLNATVAGVSGGSAPGALTYTPLAGTVLSAGNGQTLRVDAAATSNYNSAYKTVTIDVNKVTLIITADDKSKTYGAGNPSFTFTPTGFMNGDTAATAFTGAPALSTTANTSSPTGTYPITAAVGSLLSSNYSFDYHTGTLTVNAANTITNAGNATATFGANSVTLTAGVTNSSNSATVNEGTVTFTAKSGPTILGTTSGPVSGNSASATLTLGPSYVFGAYTIEAVYSDGAVPANFNGSYDATPGMLTINAANTATVASVNSPVQYSDQITLTANVNPVTLNGQPISGTVQFCLNGSPFGPAYPVNLSGVASYTLFNQLAPGSYSVTAKFTSSNANFTNSNSGPATLKITQEDARVTYTGSLMVAGGSTSATTATVTLSATVQDITAVIGDSAYDANAGDIRNASITFVNRDALSAVICTAPIGLVNPSDMKTGTATCDWLNAPIGNTGSSQYNVGIVIGNYYTRNASDDDFVVTVYQPLTSSFITGGGYLVMSSSSGLDAGGMGTKNNFGFNVKYNKQGTNLQGNINTIIRNNGRVYQIKGNSMTSLSVTPGGGCINATLSSPCSATFNGKASIQDITDPNSVISIDGNATLQVNMHDYGEPGSSDTIAITVWNKSGGLWFSSNWNGTKTSEQKLGGGNLVVH